MIPQDSEAAHKSKLHLIFQGQFSGSRYKYATLLTAAKIIKLSKRKEIIR